MDKSWKSCHDGINERSGVREIIHNMRAGDHVVSAIHAVVESGDAVDVMIFTKVDSMFGKVMMMNNFVNDPNRSVFIILVFSSLNESKSR